MRAVVRAGILAMAMLAITLVVGSLGGMYWGFMGVVTTCVVAVFGCALFIVIDAVTIMLRGEEEPESAQSPYARPARRRRRANRERWRERGQARGELPHE